MDICTRFGLEFDPFLKNSKQSIFESADYIETLARLSFLKETKGFGLITGAPGTGKTTAIRCWANSLNTSLFKVLYTPLSTLTNHEFLKNICYALDIEPSFKKCDCFRAIQNEINRLAVERHITPVFVFDEISYACNGILNDLKIIFNFEMDSKDRAIVILSGLPIFNNTLNLRSHEALKQRLIMNYNMSGLTLSESKAYIATKLQGAHCTKTIFTENALEALANISNGTSRLLSKYAHAALLFANSKGIDVIDAPDIQAVFEDCNLS